MLTNKKLQNILAKYPDDMEIVGNLLTPVVHIVNVQNEQILLSTVKPIGYCRCGEYAYPSDVRGYTGVCWGCDENLLPFEIKALSAKTQERVDGKIE